MARDRSARKLAVILHADVVGSTALVRQDEQIAHERIQDAFRRFSEVIERYGGIPRELRGDALLAEFRRASDAVCAALAFQGLNAEHNAALTDAIAPRIRVGISLGEVVIADHTLTGPDVVLAQRLEQLAEPQGVCIAVAVQQALPERLPFDLVDLGEQELKGFEQPVRAFSVALRSGVSPPEPERTAFLEARAKPPRWQWIAGAVFAALLVAGGMAAWFQPRVSPSAVIVAQSSSKPERGLAGNGAGKVEDRAAQARHEPFERSVPDRPSIAVLAFTNMSNDVEQDYFAAGIAEDLITDLSKITGLFVIARNSSFSYQGKSVPVPTIARELGVRYVLEGSVRRSQDHLRINAQLIEAAKDRQLWAERFDGGLADIFSLQDRIAQAVIAAVEVELTSDERSRGRSTRRTPDPKAYDLVLRAANLLHRLDYADAKRAKTLLQQAIQRDPDYARPYALLGLYYGDLWLLWGEQRDKNLRRTLGLTKKAAQLDDSDPTPHAIAALAHQFLREFGAAKAEADLALKLKPSDAITLATLGRALFWAHRPTEAVRLIEQAIRLDPLHPPAYLDWLSFAYGIGGRYDDCARAAERGAALEPGFVSLHVDRAICYASLGKLADAKRAGKEVLRINSGFRIRAFANFVPFSNQADIDWGVTGLRRAGLPE